MFTDDAALTHFAFEDELPKEVARVEKSMEICQNYQRGRCTLGEECPNRHIFSSLRVVQPKVCKHWLRGACANGDNCVYLHEYENRFVPICAFYESLGECANPECPFQHVRPAEQQPECAAYRRGFCALGPRCHLRHVRREACPHYMAGFCPLGPHCCLAHPIMELHDLAAVQARVLQRLMAEKDVNPLIVCHKCLDPGHITPQCPGKQRSVVRRMLAELREPGDRDLDQAAEERGVRRCYSCGQEGHTYRDCPLNARGRNRPR